jgi:hypothetical protein
MGGDPAVHAAHHLIAGANVPQLPADGAILHDDDRGIHTLVQDVDPAAAHPHGRLLVGRRIEIFRGAPGLVGRPQYRVALPHRVTAERHQLLQQPLQHALTCGRHLQLQVRELVVRAADLEVLHLECPAAFNHLVENQIQQLRIDEVAFGFDDGERGG